MTMFLEGKTLLVTRPREQAEELRMLLEKEGASVLLQPTVEIVSLDNDEKQILYDSFLSDFRRYDWLIFSSANGVKHFFELVNNIHNCNNVHNSDSAYNCNNAHSRNNIYNSNLFSLWNSSNIKIAVVGSGTDKVLQQYGYTSQLVPNDFRAEGLITSFGTEAIAGKRILSIRGDRGRDVLKVGLTKMGAVFQEISVYHSRNIEHADPQILRLIKEGMIDGITVTSSAIAESLVHLFQEDLRHYPLFSLSSLTSSALIKQGYKIAAEAEHATMTSLIDSMIQYYSRDIDGTKM